MDSRLEQVLLTTYGEVVGSAMSGALRLMGRSCRLRTSGPQPPPDRGAIVCLWHEHVLLFFAHMTSLRGRWLSLLHPAPYMKPWERVARSFNWRVALGVRLPSWDGKWLPLPGATIELHYGEPLYVTPERLEECALQLRQALDAEDGPLPV